MQKHSRFVINTIMTEKCNMNCEYCYVSKKGDELESITEPVIDSLLNFAISKLNEYERVFIDAFGGEPLLVWDKVKYLISSYDNLDLNYKKSIFIVIFTNGTLLTEEMLNYTKQYPQIYYNFSLDGTKDSHNIGRPYQSSQSSYDSVVNGIDLYSHVYGLNSQDVQKLFVVYPKNVDTLFNSMVELYKSGESSIYTIISKENWPSDKVEVYRDQIDRCTDFIIRNYTDERDFIDTGLIFSHMDSKMKHTSFCQSCTKRIGVAPNGDIYICQRFYNNRSPFKIGDVFNGIDYLNPYYNTFKNFTSSSIYKCRNCKYELHPGCEGQCFAECYELNGDPFQVIDSVCDLLKIRYDQSEKIFRQLPYMLFFPGSWPNDCFLPHGWDYPCLPFGLR